MNVPTLNQPDVLLITADPRNAEAPLAALQAPITPIEQHYVRDHFTIPQHDGTLAINGAVDHPLLLTLADLRALPATELNVTLECAGNGRLGFHPFPGGEPWSWTAVSTAVWTGVPLPLILAQAQLRPEGHTILFEGADHGRFHDGPDISYVRTLTRTEIEHHGKDILLAYAMNEKPLTPDHGAPFRLIVPGWYGMASVKWLRQIRVLSTPYEGEFQTHTYVYDWPDGTREPVTTMRVRALITDPMPEAVLTKGRHIIRGKAWSGNGVVTTVEVSIDSGTTWQPALLATAGSPYAWQEWTFEWNITAVGRHLICVRAYDSTGAVQPDLPSWNTQGYGNNAIQPLIVEVTEAGN